MLKITLSLLICTFALARGADSATKSVTVFVLKDGSEVTAKTFIAFEGSIRIVTPDNTRVTIAEADVAERRTLKVALNADEKEERAAKNAAQDAKDEAEKKAKSKLADKIRTVDALVDKRNAIKKRGDEALAAYRALDERLVNAQTELATATGDAAGADAAIESARVAIIVVTSREQLVILTGRMDAARAQKRKAVTRMELAKLEISRLEPAVASAKATLKAVESEYQDSVQAVEAARRK